MQLLPVATKQAHWTTAKLLKGEGFLTQIRRGQSQLDKQTRKGQLLEINDFAADYVTHIINFCRKEVGAWRKNNYPNTTRVTHELLTFWFNNPERIVTKKLFFAQQEAVETAIWLNEVAEKSNVGTRILSMLQERQQSVSNNSADQLPRIAFKMATGTGKTVVMACLICYHYFNRQEYRNNTRFADYFLIVVPGPLTAKRICKVKKLIPMQKKILIGLPNEY